MDSPVKDLFSSAKGSGVYDEIETAVDYIQKAGNLIVQSLQDTEHAMGWRRT